MWIVPEGVLTAIVTMSPADSPGSISIRVISSGDHGMRQGTLSAYVQQVGLENTTHPALGSALRIATTLPAADGSQNLAHASISSRRRSRASPRR